MSIDIITELWQQSVSKPANTLLSEVGGSLADNIEMGSSVDE